MDAQVASVDDYPQKTSELLDREASKASSNIPQVENISCVGKRARATKVGNIRPSGCTESAGVLYSSAENLRSSYIWSYGRGLLPLGQVETPLRF